MSDAPQLTDADLAALIAQVMPRLVALEEPILAEAGLSMWEYVIVNELAAATALSQVELSRRTGRDTSRLGRHLDELVERKVVHRERSSDQRRRTVRLTASGRGAYERAKRSIRSAEDDWLFTALSAAEAATLRGLLTRLAAS